METFVRLCPTLMFILFLTNVRRFSALSDGNIEGKTIPLQLLDSSNLTVIASFNRYRINFTQIVF